MSFLFIAIVVFLFFSSFCSVSSHQYYVSDDCSSVTHTPCHPLSVYAGNMSQYNNTIFYFIGTSSINNDVGIKLNAVKNVTLHGLHRSPKINCWNYAFILVNNSIYIIISNMLVRHCQVFVRSSTNITITGSYFAAYGSTLSLTNVFDLKVLSSVFFAYHVRLSYDPLTVCSNELIYHSLMANVTLTYSRMELHILHGTTYNVSTIFDNVDFQYTYFCMVLQDSLFSVSIIKSSFHDANSEAMIIVFEENLKSDNCKFCDASLTSTIIIEDSRFYYNFKGLRICRGMNLHEAMDYHFIIKSCLIHDNTYEGLFIDGRFMRLTQFNIIDTELIGNGGNTIVYSTTVTMCNVTVANSHSTGLALIKSSVTIKNNFIFTNNTGTVGGGLAINDSSKLILTSSANLKIINNHASYKGGGIYVDESTNSDVKLEAPNIPLTLMNNSAGLVGGDIYGYFKSLNKNQFNLTNQHIISTGNAKEICFCDPTNILESCSDFENNQYPGQTLKFFVALFGYNYFGSLTATDGTVKVYDESTPSFFSQIYITNTCSLIEYTPNHEGRIVFHTEHISTYFNYTLNECPIGFSTSSSQGICTCSPRVSRENVTCNASSLNISHNGLLWIGIHNTRIHFNANTTNLSACIINEDCLLYCTPNPVTFKLNDTDTQCANNRGQRMCGSCTEGYSLLMGSNKCGHCPNNYMAIAWVILFAVMGVLLVVLLIALNLTVSLGTLNGLLFYANIVKLYEPVFSRKGALPVLSQVISWINLDFGSEICFYNGMDSYAKQWLQFAFPLYLWIIIIIIIQLCRRYGKISRLMGSHAVPVLSTLFLLSYTKLVRTIVIVLHKREVTLHCTNESVRSVSLWYEDPNVEYAKGKHAVLFAFALMVAVFFIIPYTLFLLLNSFYEKHLSNFKVLKKVWNRFKPIIDAYSGPMKDEYRFWPGLLLLARIPVLLSVTLVDSFIQSQHFLLAMLLTVLAIVLSLGYCFGGVYMKRMNNAIETWFLFNLCIMVGLSVALNDKSKLSYMKCCNTLIKGFTKKQDEDDKPLLDMTESHKTVDQQMQEILPTFSSVKLSDSRESVVDLF
uniref:Right handed beta helix domain-containing protein n=1 Tax=Amphimedon queenslandica TaxID=400682 RepID=A0A1X7TQW6_AMPQE